MSNISAGNYTVTVTDIAGECQVESVTINEPTPLDMDILTGEELCSGLSKTASATGGTPPYAYLWSDGQIGPTAIDLQPNNYEVTVTDANGCTEIYYLIFYDLPGMTINVSSTNASSCGIPDGTATVDDVFNGTPPYAYEWFNAQGNSIGQTSQTATGLTAGTYSVAVSDATGVTNCTANGAVTVDNATGLFLTIYKQDINCSNYPDIGSASVSVLGGTTPYSYLWSNGQTDDEITNLTAGNYSVTVTDASGICDVATFTINAPVPPIISSVDANCSGPYADGEATVSVTEGTPPFSYEWFDDQYNPIGQTSQTATNLDIATYHVVVTDANGCSITGTVNINSAVNINYQNDYTVSQDVTWYNINYNVHGRIIIEDGGKLTIGQGWAVTTVKFLYDMAIPYSGPAFNMNMAGIEVRPGGKLILNNATLTGCDGGMWDGIIVYGGSGPQPANPYDPSNPHGFVHMTNSTIENAECGIYVGDPFYKDFMMGSGGIIWAEGEAGDKSVFKNNRQGVVFKGYPGENISYFNNCEFSCDDLLPPDNSGYGTKYFVEIMGGSSIDFDYVTFSNTGSFDPDKRGIGIFARLPFYNSIITKCEFTGITCGINRGFDNAYISDNTFETLDKGIEIRKFTVQLGSNVIEQNTFNNVKKGLYIKGGYLDEIKNNNIFSNIPSATINDGDNYGIFIVSSSGFNIEGNTFDGSPSDNPQQAATYGIVIENSGAGGGLIFNNVFSGTDFGLQTQDDNQNLKIRCNYFTNPGTYAWVTVDGTLKQQGADCNITGFPNYNENQAGNEWHDGCVNTTVKDIYVNDLVSFNYFAHNFNADGDPYTNPVCSSDLWKTNDLEVCLVPKTSSSCNSYIAGLPPAPPVTPYLEYIAAIKILMKDYSNKISDTKAEIAYVKSITDGGDTQEILDLIPVLPSGKLKNKILSSLPSSDTVMLSFINYPIPPGITKEMLEPNAPLSKKVIDAVYSRIPPLPKGITQEIEDAQDNLPLFPKISDLEKQIEYYLGEIQLLENELVRQMLKHGEKEEARKVLKKSKAVEAKKILAEKYLAEEEYLLTRAMLDTVLQDTIIKHIEENQNFCKLITCLVELGEDGKTIFEMDTIKEQKIREVANSKKIAAAKAEVVLELVKKENHHHPIKKINPSLDNKMAEFQESDNEEEQISNSKDIKFKLYPNPNDGAMQLDYSILSGQSGKLIIFDLIGNKLSVYRLESGKKTLKINEGELKNGIYFYKIVLNNRVIVIDKLVIIR